MNAFEKNKYSPNEFVKVALANFTIVSYGFITTIDFDSVIVTPVVTDKNSADKIRCTFMTLGDETFSVIRKPVLGMRVLVLSPNKAAEGMYESYQQITVNNGTDHISTGAPAIYSARFAFCVPLMKGTSSALNSFIIDDDLLSAEIKTELMALIKGDMELDFKGNTSIELHEGTENFRGCYGNMEEFFGMVQGANGVEKEGTYVYKETYGKYSSVEKNYESGAKITVGKAYAKPFLENKGELGDVEGPVTIELGASAPVTLTFGESQLTINADTEAGFSIALKGALKATITAESGLIKIGNTTGTLAAILNELFTALTSLATVGGPTSQTIAPQTVAAIEQVKAKVASIFE